jgi:hypothetical protein
MCQPSAAGDSLKALSLLAQRVACLWCAAHHQGLMCDDYKNDSGVRSACEVVTSKIRESFSALACFVALLPNEPVIGVLKA